MNRPDRGGRKTLLSPYFLSDLLLIVGGIVCYLALSHLHDLLNLLRRCLQIVGPFLGAVVIAWLLDPLVRFWEERVFTRGKPRLRRGLAVLVTYILVLGLITAMLYVILPQVYTSLTMLLDRIPTYLAGLGDVVGDLAERFSLFESENALHLMDSYRDLITRLAEWLRSSLPQLINTGVSIGSGIVNVLMALIASVYMLLDKRRLRSALSRCVYALIPSPYDKRFVSLLYRCNKVFTGFVDGKLLDSLIIGCLCFIGTLILRIPFAGLLSLIVGVTNIIPFFGPFIGAVPCVLILLLVEPLSALWFLLFIIVLQQLDGNVIGPRILGNSTGVSALGVMVSITVGAGLAGMAGMLLGVPLYAILSMLLREYLEARMEKKRAAQGEWSDGSVQMSMSGMEPTPPAARPADKKCPSALQRLLRARRAAKAVKAAAAPLEGDAAGPDAAAGQDTAGPDADQAPEREEATP